MNDAIDVKEISHVWLKYGFYFWWKKKPWNLTAIYTLLSLIEGCVYYHIIDSSRILLLYFHAVNLLSYELIY